MHEAGPFATAGDPAEPVKGARLRRGGHARSRAVEKRMQICLIVASALLFGAVAPGDRDDAQSRGPDRGTITGAPGLDPTALDRRVEDLLRRDGQGIEATAWLGGASGPAWYERHPSRAMPTASAIKTFFLVELFASRRGDLDRPIPGAGEILDDDGHPAISHFSPEQREEIRRILGRASARRVGEIMMGKAPASNAVYNAAANLVTAILGGPEALTGLIHARDEAFSGVFVRRYMLRDRKQTGDNEAPAAALAALYQKLASRNLPGVDEDTIEAIRGAMIRSGDQETGIVYSKGGSLNSDPLTRVQAGWKETTGGVVVYVVMTSHPAPGSRQAGPAASTNLARTCSSIRQTIVDAAADVTGGSSPVTPSR